MSSVDIFLMESFANSDFAIAVYVLFFVIVTLCEYRLQSSNKRMPRVALLNATYTVFIWQVLTISEYIWAWGADSLGGEYGATFVLPVVAFATLFVAKRLSLSHAGITFKYPNLMCLVPLAIPFTPLLLLLAYVIAMAGAFNH